MATESPPRRLENVIVMVALLAVAMLLALDLLRPSSGCVTSLHHHDAAQSAGRVPLDEPARR
jgi:hypothetical protein